MKYFEQVLIQTISSCSSAESFLALRTSVIGDVRNTEAICILW